MMCDEMDYYLFFPIKISRVAYLLHLFESANYLFIMNRYENDSFKI